MDEWMAAQKIEYVDEWMKEQKLGVWMCMGCIGIRWMSCGGLMKRWKKEG